MSGKLFVYDMDITGEIPEDDYIASLPTVRNLRAESFYNAASNIYDLDRHYGGNRMLIESYGGKSLHEQSYGESFLSLVEHRFNGYGLYILDEPEAALSPMKLMTLMCLIRNVADAIPLWRTSFWSFPRTSGWRNSPRAV